MNKASKKYGIMWKDLIHLIGVTECDGENESKLENTLKDIIQNFPNLARRPTLKSRKYREYLKDIPQEEQPQST